MDLPRKSEPSPLAGSKVLITGGYGFLGAYLAEALLAGGNVVTALDRAPYQGSVADLLCLHQRPGFLRVDGDLLDPTLKVGDDYEFVVHAAAVLGVNRVVAQPIDTLDVNIQGARRCLELASQQRILRRFLLLSTSETYGVDAIDATENQPASVATDSPRWGYAASKLAAEFYGHAFAREYGIPITIVRPFNVYGPFRLGENAVTSMVVRALAGQELVVSGDGSQRRSWCFVSDFVRGAELCLTCPAAQHQVINLGNNRADLSLLELAELIVALTGSASPVRVLGGSKPDVRARRPALHKARSLLGYEPAIDITAGLQRVIAAQRRGR